MSTFEGMEVGSAAPALHSLWRDPDPAALLARWPLADAAVRSVDACVQAAAFDVVDTLVERRASPPADFKRDCGTGRPRDCLATDLLAGALLAEAIEGDEMARIAITHLRRQRKLEDFAWPSLAQRSDDLADDGEMAELAVLAP